MSISSFSLKIFTYAKGLFSLFRDRGLYKLSYAQEGEDLILGRIFDRSSSGYYIDIGAHHPVRFSNTYLFYKRGWRGVCVDPSQDAIALFKQRRPADIALEMGVSDQESELTYYMFDEPALNTFSKILADQRIENTTYKSIGTRKVPVRPLNKILDEILQPGTKIDFMTIDVEGLDYQVLVSNDWSKYRPRIVLAEALDDEAGERIRAFMIQNNYKIIARTFNTEFYQDCSNL
ncbi:FkbM family methyltransferase [Methylobacillus gramineus]|uniref:FkbM family methyltransferase n=1 Tax=Methylobacillus gramineus TaxID=755169 RepID=UPI001CFF9A8A|nr:FkbM family methyltransferase [Methylobacillus gramineus]MCB5184122.1 FkbM family methyltransferase [Methylobacillus gramineus]